MVDAMKRANFAVRWMGVVLAVLVLAAWTVRCDEADFAGARAGIEQGEGE